MSMILNKYIGDIEEIMNISNFDENLISKLNLNKIKNLFDRLKNYISQELNMKLKSEKPNYEYYNILEFIAEDILPKYEDLTSCELFFNNNESPSFEYYVKCNDSLSFEERESLTRNLIDEIYDYCLSRHFEDIFKTIFVFLLKRFQKLPK